MARAGLMEDAPRPPTRPILPRRLMTWVIASGVVIAAGTLAVIAWSTTEYGDAVARTMGLTVFSLFNVWFALETSDEDRSIFSGELFHNGTLIKAALAALLATILATELGLLQRLLDTVSLSLDQWAVCIAVSLAIVVVAEVRKLLHIRVSEINDKAVSQATPASAPVAGATTA